ncbi:MAG: DUF4369 domain-containing protein [Prevotella sp.]|nr:DUF4369 domain-containing protein [Prevotella sp.]
MKSVVWEGCVSLIFLLFSCQPDAYQINGFARSFQEGDTICLALEDGKGLLSQTIVDNGRFLFEGKTDGISLCRAYVKREPDCGVTFFLEPEVLTVEINPETERSRVSGSRINNEWQMLSDSINLLAKDIVKKDAKEIDSLHRRMSDCIQNAARRNKDNYLGKYIEENYKKPEFK